MLRSAWHYYCIFFHFNPAGFIFLHGFLGIAITAMIHEWLWQRKHKDDNEVVLKHIEYHD